MHPDAPSHARLSAADPQHARLADTIVRAGGRIPQSIRPELFRLPLPSVLDLFASAAPRVPRHAGYLHYGHAIIGVPEPELDAWYTEAWWGTYASAACENRLVVAEREHEVLGLVLPVDWDPLDALLARGRGVLLAASHSGVPYVLTALLSTTGRPTLQVGDWYNRHHLPGTDLSHAGSPTGLTRLYLQAFQRLRAGGIATIAPDGRHWRQGIDETFFGHPCRVSLAPAALARLTDALSLPVMANWEGNRIRIEFSAVQEAETEGGEAADRRWTRRYLDWLEGMVRAHPCAVRFNHLLPATTPPKGQDHVDR